LYIVYLTVAINHFDLFLYCKGLNLTAAVKHENQILGIIFKDLSPDTPCMGYTAGLNLPLQPI